MDQVCWTVNSMEENHWKNHEDHPSAETDVLLVTWQMKEQENGINAKEGKKECSGKNLGKDGNEVSVAVWSKKRLGMQPFNF